LALERINNLLMRYDMRDPLFEQNIREYIGEHSRHFMHELISFARSPYDMMGYDRHVTHGRWYPHLQNYGLPEDDSSDSEDDIVELPLPLSTRATVAINIPPIDLSHTARFRVDRDVYTPPSRSPSPEPGPSGLSSFRATSPFLIESSDEESVVNPNGNDNDIGGSVSDVEVVAVLKPKHERTPEIIDLDSDSESNETALPNNSLAIPWDEPSASHYGSSYIDPGPSTSSYNPNLTNSTGSEFKTETNSDATINLSVMHNDSSISAHPVSSDTLSPEIPVARKSKHKKHKKSKNRILSSDEESVDRYKSRHKKRKSSISKTSDYGSDYERKSRKRKHKHSSSRRYEEDRSSHNLSEESNDPSDHTVHHEKKKCCCKWKVKKVAEMSDCEQQKPRLRSIIVKMPDTDTGSISHSSHSHSQPTSSDSDDNWEPQSRYKKFVRKGKGKRK
jgi:E3 ubiquitin-protein ligase Topors